MGGTAGNGLSGQLIAPLPILMIIGAFYALSLYNALEIFFSIFSVFRRYKGLYFFSMIVATCAIPIHQTGFLLKFFSVSRSWPLTFTLMVAGWFGMVVGQSVVLWCRLGLVLSDKRKIRWLLVIIIANPLIFYVPTAIFAYLANISKPKPSMVQAYSTAEKVQVTIFSAQEATIASFYIYYAWHMLRPIANGFATGNRNKSRRLLWDLIAVNLLVICMDISMLGTEYANQYMIQTIYKGFIYSVKLKLEFHVLNKLFSFLHNRTGNGPRSTEGRDLHAMPGFPSKSCEATDTGLDSKFRGTITTTSPVKGGEESYGYPLSERIHCQHTIDVQVEEYSYKGRPGSDKDLRVASEVIEATSASTSVQGIATNGA